ncbi:MAG: hypothetical protein KatS3mg114_0233 [Planctomycetaceae bacterium]|nr:MAG: hypothetical protein KatS3mg114_0233 [Planctomycetaceae bacterium]
MPFNIGMPELIFFGFIALLLFGKRLPEVARSLGKGVTEFKKGLRDVSDEMNNVMYDRDDRSQTYARPTPPEERYESSAPKFEPPTSPPQV